MTTSNSRSDRSAARRSTRGIAAVAGRMIAALAMTAPAARAGLVVEALGPRFDAAPARVVASQTKGDAGGNTSVRNRLPLEWKDQGYFQRNRDLGQVFTAPHDFTLEAIVLRTGPGDIAFQPGSAGARVFVQFFEVEGDPILDDGETPSGMKATHGFSANHRCDDVLRGVEYRPLRVARGGVMPNLAAGGDGRGVYMRWTLTGDDRIECRGGRRYGFMVGFEEPGDRRGFALANRNLAGSPAPPRLDDPADPYPGGWAIRREGDGTLPPTMRPGPEPSPDAGVFRREALFPDGDARFRIPPTTDGYPDVDTYRDLEFYLLAAAEPPPAGYARPPGPTLRDLAQTIGFHVGANFPNLYAGWIEPGARGPGRYDPEAAIARDHFTIMTAGWEIFPGHTWKGEGRYDFDGSDRYIEWCRTNGIAFHGHGLGYVFRAGWPFAKLPVETEEERARVREIYERYVQDTAGHFRGRVHLWDVCNEHLLPPYQSGRWLKWDERNGPREYWKAYAMDPRDPDRGCDWYVKTLTTAHEADPAAKLVLLDFNNEIVCPKSDAMFALATTLLARRLPLHGVGFQMHVNTEFKRAVWKKGAAEPGGHDLSDDAYVDSLRRNIRRFAELGLEVWITEMSVDLHPGRPPEAELERQAEVYGRVFEACLCEPGMRGIKLWGVMDPGDRPGRPCHRPYLFDATGRAKPAFFAVRRALETAAARPAAASAISSRPNR